MKTLNKNENWRCERKFVVLDSSPEEVALLLKLNSLDFSEIYWARKINSLYFDSEDLDFYSQNAEGSPQKIKVRIRWYGEDLPLAKNPKLEIKVKRGEVNKKISFPLPDFNLKDFLDVGSPENEFEKYLRNSFLPDEYKIKVLLLKPSVITSYWRRYFLSCNEHFRATLDFDLESLLPWNLMRFLPWDSYQNLILEIKYCPDYDLEARSFISHLPFRLDKYSKYSLALREIFG